MCGNKTDACPTQPRCSNYTIRISYLLTSGRFRRSNYIAPPIVIGPRAVASGALSH